MHKNITNNNLIIWIRINSYKLFVNVKAVGLIFVWM